MIQARLISMDRGGKRAQVVIYLGEGSQRRSLTRHVRLEGPGYLWGVGRSIDESGLARLDAAEVALKRAEHEYGFFRNSAEISFKEINGWLRRIRWCREAMCDLPPVFREAVERVLLADQELNAKAIKTALRRMVAESAAALQITRERAEQLRREIPRWISFQWG